MPRYCRELTAEDLKDLGREPRWASAQAARRRLRRLRSGVGLVSDTPAAASAVERRQLTVMFCDLVGSTELPLVLRASHTIKPIRVGIERGLVAADHKIGKFAIDFLLEEVGFELSVPLRRATASELSVPPAVNGVGARLPRKRAGVYPVSGWRRVLRSCCPHLAPCAAAHRPPGDRVQRSPALHEQRAVAAG